jgi:hypothetical protein
LLTQRSGLGQESVPEEEMTLAETAEIAEGSKRSKGLKAEDSEVEALALLSGLGDLCERTFRKSS